ncbi:hypothetical protein [Enterococcus rivorum]|uniref:Uncharacterized protein n=1 Tax=Enterococcus rivorum TaxID=762845 RepID=A0A1E5L0D0_9ENTE|nr:hypothetical protein [Enterococcus rivorum]MBP2098838.1 hypothetical protein [Enterococcus rivorum]OEH83568.1 hypothetical protein BCR26_08800 [Enterococcus rivorum]
MRADSTLIEWLLHEHKENAASIARNSGVPATTIKDLKNGISNINNFRFGNAAKLTRYAETKKLGDPKVSQEKIDYLLEEFKFKGKEISETELYRLALDYYFELVKGKFIEIK